MSALKGFVSFLLVFVCLSVAPQQVRAEICWEPLSVGGPTLALDGGISDDKQNNKKGQKGKKGTYEAGEITPQHICDYPTPTPPTPSRPGIPNVSVTNSTSGTYTVSWSASSNMDTSPRGQWGYELLEYRDGSYVKTYRTSATTRSQSMSSNSDGNYQYKVRGCNMNLNTGLTVCSNYSSLSSTNYVRHKPSQPSTPSLDSGTSTGSVTVSWSKPSGRVTFYRIQKRHNNGSWSWADSSYSGTSKTVSGLTDGSWDFRVRACNDDTWACSTWSGVTSDVTVRLKPSTPSAPSVTDTTVSNGHITVSWSKPSGTVGLYDVIEYKAGVSGYTVVANDTTATSLNVTGRADGDYRYRVRACNVSWSCSAYSGYSATTEARSAPSTPSAPSITDTTVSNGHITVSWSTPSGTVGLYDVIEYKTGVSGYTVVANDTTATSLSVTGRADGDYRYRVRACNVSWSCSAYSGYSATTEARSAPSTPSAPSVTDTTVSNGHITVSWSTPSGTVGLYDVIEYKTGVSGYTVVANDTTATSLSVTGRADGDYRYRVRACNVSWSCSAYSGYSAYASVLHTPGTPAFLSGPASASASGSVTLSWGDSSGRVDYYETAHRRKPPGGTFGGWSYTDRGDVNAYAYSGLADGEWDFAVRGCNASGCSGWRYITSRVQVLHVPGIPASIAGPTLTDVDGSHTVSWGVAGGQVDAYELRQRFKARGASSFGAWSTVYDGTGRSKSLTLLANGEYDYAIRACNTSGCSGFQYLSPRVTVLNPPYSPSVSVDSSSDDGSYRVSWQSGGGVVDEYRYAESPDYSPWVSVGTASSTVMDGKGDGSWRYKVTACNTSGCSADSLSNTVTVTHPTPAAPGSISVPVETAESRYRISWAASTSGETDFYEVSNRHDSNGWSGWSRVTGTATQVVVADGGDWTHRVRACNELPDKTAKCSSARVSGPVSVQLPPQWARTGGSVSDSSNGFVDSLTTDETVGAIEGRAGVSGGAATYHVPIVVPPGRKGMQPKVSLNYSSRSGNGIAGLGWSLSATSTIHRCGKTVAQDGNYKSAVYQASDKLCLDGARLIAVQGEYGQSGTVYRAELDQFLRVTQNSDYNSLNSSFTVETQGNRVKVYGGTLDSRHSTNNWGQPFRWALSSESDASGNAITYQYNEFGTGEHLLSVITYTEHSNLAGNREVKFLYEARADKSTFYRAGVQSGITRRLSAIETYVDSNKIREYDLAYDYGLSTGSSILSSLEECVGTKCLSKTIFNSNNAPLNFSQLNVAEDVAVEYIPLYDFDGDGRKEFFKVETVDVPFQPGSQAIKRRYQQSWLVSLDDTGQELWVKDISSDTGKSIWLSLPNIKSSLNRGFIADITSNGLPDIMTYEQVGGADTGDSNDDIFNLVIREFDPSQSEAFEKEVVRISSAPSDNDSRAHILGRFYDYDADGDVDIVVSNNMDDTTSSRSDYKYDMVIYVVENIGTSGNPSFDNTFIEVERLRQKWDDRVSVLPFQYQEQDTIDFDGNGISDIRLTSNLCYLSDSSRVDVIFNDGNNFVRSNYVSLGIESNHLPHETYHHWVDINGDGLTDYVFIPNRSTTIAKTWHYQLNTGERGANMFLVPVNTGNSTGMVATDVNGSERFSKNNCFETTNMYTPKFSRMLQFADYDSDGINELLAPTSEVPTTRACVVIEQTEPDEGRSDPTSPEEEPVIPTEYCAYDGSGTSHGEMYAEGEGAKDRSIYNFAAFKFDVGLGSLNKVANSDHHFAAGRTAGRNATVYTDYNGDGLLDVGLKTFKFIAFDTIRYRWDEPLPAGLTDSSFYIFEREARQEVGSVSEYHLPEQLVSVEDGLGNLSEWGFAPISSSSTRASSEPRLYDVPDINSSERYIDDEHFYFTSSMIVVDSFKQSDGVGGFNESKYSYREAVYNKLGRGFQGFRTIIVDNLASHIRSTTDFHQKFPKAGKIETAVTCLMDSYSDGCRRNLITQTSVEYAIKDTANANVKWVYPSKTREDIYNLESNSLGWVETIIGPTGVDNYGNIKKSVTTSYNGFQKTKTTTTNSYDSRVSDWWLNKIASNSVKTETIERDEIKGASDAVASDLAVTTRTDYAYSSDGMTHRLPTTTALTSSDTANIVHTTSIDLNLYGQPTSTTTVGSGDAEVNSELTRVSSMVYTADSYFVEETENSKGHNTSYTVSKKHGQPLTVTDANGNTVTHTYDGFGRLTSSTVPGGRTHYKGYRWCDSSCPSTAQYYEFRKQAGSPTVKHYKDSFNRTLLTQAQGFGGAPIYTRIDYDGLGRKTFESIPSFDANPSVGTRYSSYDTLGRLTYKATDQANAGVMTTRYSYHGHTTDITATDGSILTMSRTYGTDGKLIQTVDAAQGKTGYAYDSRGNPITLTDANDHSIHAWYNGFGHKWQVDDPNMGVKSFAYNTFGEVESETDANGDTVTHRYDSVGRLTERRVNGVAQAEFIYDTAANGLGLLAGELGQGIAKSYTYDGYSRTKTTTTSIDNTPYTAEVFYDGGNGRVKAYRYPGSALTVGYGYDAYGYQTQVFNAESGFVYQAVSRRDARLNVLQAFKNYSDDTDADKLREERTYAPASGQLTMIDLKTEWGAEQQHNLSYVYGDFGNLDSQAQWHPGGITTETYVYDRLHRLTHSQSTPYGPIDYEYDAVGNLIKKSDYASVIHYGAVGNSNTANAGPNAITGITRNGTVIDDFLYDNNGNLRDGNGKSLSYNAFNKPISISKGGITSTFAYGADLSRYKHLKTKAGQTDETTLYIGKQVEIVQSGDSTTTKTYIDDIAIVEKEETVNQSLADHRIRFTHRDRLGSVITLTDHHNQITEQRSYDAFGKPRNADMSDGLSATLLGTNDNVSVFTPRGFTDHEHLDDAELIHMNGRAYDYNLGRFLSVDPFIQAPGNSQSMNPYSYIMNNPLAGTDPSGYKSICGKGELRSCDAVIYPNGNTSSVGSAESNNGKDTNATLYIIHKSDQKIESLGDIKSEDVLGIAIVDDSHADFTDMALGFAVSGGTDLGSLARLACNDCSGMGSFFSETSNDFSVQAPFTMPSQAVAQDAADGWNSMTVEQRQDMFIDAAAEGFTIASMIPGRGTGSGRAGIAGVKQLTKGFIKRALQSFRGMFSRKGDDTLQYILSIQSRKGNFNISSMSADKAHELGSSFVGANPVNIYKKGNIIGIRSADGLRQYRFPAQKLSGRAKGNTQANIEEFFINSSGDKIKIRNAHINITR